MEGSTRVREKRMEAGSYKTTSQVGQINAGRSDGADGNCCSWRLAFDTGPEGPELESEQAHREQKAVYSGRKVAGF